MPRIPEADIERVKAATDLAALVQSRGVALKQQGANWTGFCPFHDDQTTPNFIVTPAKGLWRCMAACCGKSGNAIQFVERFDGVSFRHAYELLAGGGAAAFQQTGGPRKIATVPRLPCPLETTAEDAALLEQAANYYVSRIVAPENRAARDYLAGRGLDDDDLLERFGVGFADRTLGLRLPDSNRKAGADLRGRLLALGIYRPTGREHLNGCVTVPVRDTAGRITQIYGRRIDPRAPKQNRHLWLARPLAGIFNPAALKQREIILCESILDALTFIRHGMEAATCTFGTTNFTAELFDAIKAAKVESVRLAFDADEAGEAAAAQAAQRLQAVGVECHRIRFPWGADANEHALDQGGEALRRAVRSAEWLGAGPPKVNGAVTSNTSGPGANTVRTSSLAANPQAAKEKDVVGTPSAPAPPEPVRKGEHLELQLGDRLWRVGGLEKNNSLEAMKVTLRVMEPGGLFHLDSLDLYRDAERRRFTERAAEETLLDKELLRRDLGKLLLAMERLQEERLAAPAAAAHAAPQLTPEETAEAMELLRAPDLLERLAASFRVAGIVGEETNVLAAYLACTSRLLEKPLAVIIQSTSAAGKTTLMDAVLSFFPREEQVKYSAMTGQSLYYLGESDLKHKILAIVEEEGAEKAGYALKLLQSEGELTIASTGKDPHTGRMETQEYHVEGPAAILLTTTSIDLDEELMNRCLVLTVDESREQTERIHALQREARTVEGIMAAERGNDVLRVMRNAQRLLEPLRVANPFARELTFTAGRTRTRRDHEKYLTLIDAVALLHQHQREPIRRGTGGREIAMLPVTLEDIAAANRIAPEVLGRSLDELPPQTRRLLESVKALVRERMQAKQTEQRLCLFTRGEVRDAAGLSYMQAKRHLERLAELEYLAPRHGRNGSTFLYELLVDAAEPPDACHTGLLDIAKLRQKHAYTADLTIKTGDLTPPYPPPVISPDASNGGPSGPTLPPYQNAHQDHREKLSS